MSATKNVMGAPGDVGAAADRGRAQGAGNDRIVATLNELACRPDGAPWGVRELAETLGGSRSTVNRILQHLSEQGLASRDANGNYTAGPRLRVLANGLLDRHPLLGSARSIIDTLARSCDATALLALYDPSAGRCFVAMVTVAPSPVRYNLGPGTVIPLHAGAAGRAILAELGVDAVDEAALTAFTEDTVTDRAGLERLLAEDRAACYTVSVGQHFALAAGVAAPFRFGGLLGAVSVTRPRYDTTDADLLRFAPQVQDAARRLSALPPEPVNSPVLVRESNPAPVASAGGSVTTPGSEGGSAVARFERLLAALVAESAGLETTGRRLARRIGANPATAAKLLGTALECGLALRRGERAVAGPRLLYWAAALGATAGVVSVTAHIVAALAADTGETIGLAEFDSRSRHAQLTTVVPGSRPLHYGLATGVDIPLHAGAAGKAILAELPGEVLDGLALTQYTERTVRSRAELEDDLDGVRVRGWAAGDGERIPDAFGIAAAYFVDGVVAGSVTVTIPRFRVPEVDIDAVAEKIVHAAREVTALLTVSASA
ncbi:IclR family transcriptional regulator C-terminal domain-containing protein [Rhodococcus opacus]|nr:IclR family transcriptional regulator [Rhodococcus wratislaviensis IFP 2016]WKN59992.1 IclR family transcriptional regulator C-terminal domain-containing protein [Rhodococcus opacus]